MHGHSHTGTRRACAGRLFVPSRVRLPKSNISLTWTSPVVLRKGGNRNKKGMHSRLQGRCIADVNASENTRPCSLQPLMSPALNVSDQTKGMFPCRQRYISFDLLLMIYAPRRHRRACSQRQSTTELRKSCNTDIQSSSSSLAYSIRRESIHGNEGLRRRPKEEETLVPPSTRFSHTLYAQHLGL